MPLPIDLAAALLAGLLAGADPDHADAIDAIVDATADARVIFLGEPDHGDGGSMTARAQLTERLYREAGVRWVVFESSVFGAERADAAITRGEDPIPAARANVLDIWSASRELEPLFRLIATSREEGPPLRLAGMDSTPIGLEGRTAHLERLAVDARLLADGDLRARMSEVIGRIRAWSDAFDPTTRMPRPAELVAEIDALSRALADTPDLALQLRGWAVWIRVVTPQFPLSQEAIDDRDRFMADALLALLRRIPADERVVVWAHNVHIMRVNPIVTDPETGARLEGMTIPAAAVVAEVLGDEAYCLGLAAASGRVQASWNPSPREIELRAGSFEQRAIAGSSADSVFVDCASIDPDLTGVMPGGMVSFMDMSCDWSGAFDGVWVLRSTSPVTRTSR